MLSIEVPATYQEERNYILRFIFEYCWGIEVNIQATGRCDTCISRGDEKHLIVAEGLFAVPEEKWLQSISLPPREPVMWGVPHELIDGSNLPSKLPILYGKSPKDVDFIEIENHAISLGLDIFGSSFFMLSRYEEAIPGERDVHGRFLARESIAHQWGILERPIVNEYLELLWSLLSRLWPNLSRIERTYRVHLSHDVDRPYSSDGALNVLKSAGADIVRRKDLSLALRRLRCGLVGRGDGRTHDPFNNFDYVMNQSEKFGLKSAFFFIPSQGRPGGSFGSYDLASPFLIEVMRRIALRNHEIGFHPNYGTYMDANRTRSEFARFRAVAETVGVNQDEWGGRQHYLQWENPGTWQNWQDAGLSYDSTLTFADHVGFRCGICFDYPVFNLHAKKMLELHERPLVVMECSLLDYMGIDIDSTIQRIVVLANECRRYRGSFTMLWHNDYLISKRQRDTYEQVLRQIN